MAKGQVHLGLRTMKPVDAQKRARTVGAKMKGNASYPNPPVQPDDLVKAADAAAKADATAHQKHQEAVIATHEAAVAHKDLSEKLKLQAAYVDHLAQGDPTLVAEAGFEAQGAPVKTLEPTAPTHAQLTMGDKPGTLDFHWDPPHHHGKKTYIVQCRVAGKTPAADFAQFGIVSRSKLRLVGLVSGELYEARVATTDDGVQSAWSDVATKMAP